MPFFICYVLSFNAQNLIPNPGFEQVRVLNNDVNNITTGTYFWNSIGGVDWFHPDNINPTNGNQCNSPYCVGAPKNFRGWQQAHTGLAYAGFYSYFRNSFSYREMMEAPLISDLVINKQYCVSFYVSLADTARYAHSLLSALFVTDTGPIHSSTINSPATWTNNYNQQVTNTSGFLSSKTDWMKVEGFFTADSAYKYMIVGEFTNVVLHDTLHMPTGDNIANGFGYYYIDDVSVTELDEPVSAAATDTLIANENTIIQLGNNTNINANYLWSPSLNISDVNNPSPTLYVTQSGWYHVQKTQCSYVTNDSVYVKANPVGINEYNAQNALFSLLPNPNNGEFVLQNKLNKSISGTLFIYDVTGKLIEERVVKDAISIDVKLQNASGIYFLRLANENNVTVYLGKALVR